MSKLNKPVNRYHSAEDFVNSARSTYHLDRGRDRGFVEYMRSLGKFNMINERDFIPYLKHYLGKD